jgi:transcriptional regulator with XRE-family HTH domain
VAARAAPIGEVTFAVDAQTPVLRQLEDIKRRSRLTWEQIADAMGVEARAVHLWRRGGGISAEHEERLHELSALIENIDLGTPDDTRRELVEAVAGESLLERLRGGESPRALLASSPWRSRARDELRRNVAARAGGGGLDEDYLFLLYLDDAGVGEFADRATALLDEPASSRSSWESMIEAELDRMEQPAAVVVEPEEKEEEPLEEAGEPAPLFDLADLDIPLGVGAIAARRALSEGA